MATRQSTAGFEQVDATSQGDNLAAYLDLMTELPAVRAYRRRMVELLAAGTEDPGRGNVSGDQRWLDLGCGTGSETARLASGELPGTVIGADASLHMLARARRRPLPSPEGEKHPSVGAADARRLPFADGAFDGCRAERILQHLHDPGDAVAELARVCRPGGRVVVSEPDWGTMAVDVEDRDLARRVLGAMSERVPCGWIGRRLPALFRAAGLEIVAVEAHALSVEGYSSADGFFGIASGALRALEADLLSAVDTARWLAALEQREKESPLVASLTGFTVCGRRPVAS
ncbi:MAG: methyltransferase domain-containing protein [Acidobacteriota bacterium]